MRTVDDYEISRFKNNAFIIVSSGIEKGIFFRNPIRKFSYDFFSTRKIGFIEKLVTPGLKNRLKRFQTGEWDGIYFNTLQCPIYFRREYRKLHAESDGLVIKSYGYNQLDEEVGGHCDYEKTKVVLNGKTVSNNRTDVNNGYKMIYKHVVLEKFDGFVKEEK